MDEIGKRSNMELEFLDRVIENYENIFNILNNALNEVYLKRRGRMMWNEDGTWSEAWCVICGKHQVNPDAGEDTCSTCCMVK